MVTFGLLSVFVALLRWFVALPCCPALLALSWATLAQYTFVYFWFEQ
jgi:hypothetical protein